MSSEEAYVQAKARRADTYTQPSWARICRTGVLLVLVLATCLHAQTPTANRRSSRRVVTFGGDLAYPPYTFLKNGGPTGFSIELIQAVGAVMNFDVEIKMGRWTQILPAVREGKIDVTDAVIAGDRPAEFDFSVPISKVTYVLFVRKGSTIRTLHDARQKKIVVERGDFTHDFLVTSHLTRRVVPVSSTLDGLKLLSSGRADGAFAPRTQGLFYIRTYKLENTRPSSAALPSLDYAFATKQGNPALVRDIDEGLAVLKENGVYTKLYNKWFGVYQPWSLYESLRYYLYAGGFIVLLLLASLLWSWSLRRQVRARTAELTREIEQRQRTQEALGESTRKFRSLYENMMDAFVYTDLTGRILEFNEGYRQMLGYEPDELRNLNYRSVTPQKWHASEDKLIEEQTPVRGYTDAYEKEYIRKDGSIVPIEVRVCLVRDEQGKPSGFWGIVRDITERKNAEQALRDSERRLSDIINFLPDATFAIDLQGRVIAWNRAVELLTGVKAEDILGKGNYEYSLAFYESRRPMLIGIILQPEEDARQQYPFFKREGDAILAEAYTPLLGAHLWGKASLLYDPEGNVVGAIESVRDVTERKRVEEEKRAFYRSTIMSVTDGKLLIADMRDLEPFLQESSITMDVVCPSDVSRARRAAAEVCAEAGRSGDRLDAFVLAAGEAITNGIKHAKSATVYAGLGHDTVWVGVSDTGPGIDSLILPKAILKRGFSTKPSMGLGYSIMLEVSDRVLLNTGFSGTTVVLVKDIIEEPPYQMVKLIDTWNGIPAPTSPDR